MELEFLYAIREYFLSPREYLTFMGRHLRLCRDCSGSPDSFKVSFILPPDLTSGAPLRLRWKRNCGPG